MPRSLLLLLTLALVATLPAAASASTLLTRNPQGPIRLAVSKDGVALITVKTEGRVHRILAWGAINLSKGRLNLDYSGGTAGPVDVRLSHWRGPVADLEVYTDWSRYGPSKTIKWPHLFGTYSWQGNPIAVGLATPGGVPLDNLGRNLYLDSLNPDYGYPAGSRTWRRVNGLMANRPHGQFCFEIGPKRSATVALGRTHAGISSANRYRITTPGPGVTPDIRRIFAGPPSPYDPYWQLEMNALQRQVVGDPYANCGSPLPPTF